MLPSDEVPFSEAGEPSAPTLAYGIKCLRNALQLCELQLSSITTADYAALQAQAVRGKWLRRGDSPLRTDSVDGEGGGEGGDRMG